MRFFLLFLLTLTSITIKSQELKNSNLSINSCREIVIDYYNVIYSEYNLKNSSIQRVARIKSNVLLIIHDIDLQIKPESWGAFNSNDIVINKIFYYSLHHIWTQSRDKELFSECNFLEIEFQLEFRFIDGRKMSITRSIYDSDIKTLPVPFVQSDIEQRLRR